MTGVQTCALPISLHGSSLLPVFKGETRKEPDFFISGMEKFRMFRKGDYKIVRMNGEDWELYNLKNDPTEIENLASKLPEKVIELLNIYKQNAGIYTISQN